MPKLPKLEWSACGMPTGRTGSDAMAKGEQRSNKEKKKPKKDKPKSTADAPFGSRDVKTQTKPKH